MTGRIAQTTLNRCKAQRIGREEPLSKPIDHTIQDLRLSNRLFDEMARKFPASSYPAKTSAIPTWNVKRGFFPGASGHWQQAAHCSLKIMCIGQDFGHRQDYLDALAGGESEKGPTWRNLLGLLRRAGVDVESCFFTNALVGTRETESNTGPSLPHRP